MLTNKPIGMNEEDEDLKCPVCSIFFSQLNKPYILQCNHNLCLSCIEGVKSKNMLFCPICRLPFKPDTNFHVNFSFLNLILKILKNKNIFCSECKRIFNFLDHYTVCNPAKFIETTDIMNELSALCLNCITFANEFQSILTMITNQEEELNQEIENIKMQVMETFEEKMLITRRYIDDNISSYDKSIRLILLGPKGMDAYKVHNQPTTTDIIESFINSFDDVCEFLNNCVKLDIIKKSEIEFLEERKNKVYGLVSGCSDDDKCDPHNLPNNHSIGFIEKFIKTNMQSMSASRTSSNKKLSELKISPLIRAGSLISSPFKISKLNSSHSNNYNSVSKDDRQAISPILFRRLNNLINESTDNIPAEILGSKFANNSRSRSLNCNSKSMFNSKDASAFKSHINRTAERGPILSYRGESQKAIDHRVSDETRKNSMSYFSNREIVRLNKIADNSIKNINEEDSYQSISCQDEDIKNSTTPRKGLISSEERENYDDNVSERFATEFSHKAKATPSSIANKNKPNFIEKLNFIPSSNAGTDEGKSKANIKTLRKNILIDDLMTDTQAPTSRANNKLVIRSKKIVTTKETKITKPEASEPSIKKFKVESNEIEAQNNNLAEMTFKCGFPTLMGEDDSSLIQQGQSKDHLLNLVLENYNKIKDLIRRIGEETTKTEAVYNSIRSQLKRNFSYNKESFSKIWETIFSNIHPEEVNKSKSKFKYLLANLIENTKKVWVFNINKFKSEVRELHNLKFQFSSGMSVDCNENGSVLFVTGGIATGNPNESSLFKFFEDTSNSQPKQFVNYYVNRDDRFSNLFLIYYWDSGLHEILHMPHRRAYHSSLYRNKKLMIIGGLSNYSTTIKDCSYYDWGKKQWHLLPPLCQGRACASICLYNENIIYCFRGFNAESSKCLDSIEILNINNLDNGWTELIPDDPGYSWNKLCYSSCISFSADKIFIVGGTSSFSRDSKANKEDYVKSAFVFNPITRTVYKSSDLFKSACFNSIGTYKESSNSVVSIDYKNETNRMYGIHSFSLDSKAWKFII